MVSEVLLPKGEVGRSYLEFYSFLVVPSAALLQ